MILIQAFQQEIERKLNKHEVIKKRNPQNDAHGENYHVFPRTFAHICDNLFLHFLQHQIKERMHICVVLISA